MKFTKQEVDTIEEWRDEVADEIKSVLSDELSPTQTTEEEDRGIAEKIFERLLAAGRLEMPEGKIALASGGLMPRIPEASYTAGGDR